MDTQLVTVEVALQASTLVLRQAVEATLAPWACCSNWLVTDVDVQRQIVVVTAPVMIEDNRNEPLSIASLM